jgi:hypothetical protein
MLTIFTIPKPFSGHIGIIQRNALASWRRLLPRAELVLFGMDNGVAEAAREFGARHEPVLAVNAFGTPLVSDAFARARRGAAHPLLMYSNADMLYDGSLVAAMRAVKDHGSFLLSGRRWDVDIGHDLVGAPEESWRSVFSERSARGRLHGHSAMDFFVLPRTLDLGMPEFAVGRVGWDSWMIWRCRQLGIPVIDATADVAALHQNHSYSSLQLGCQRWHGPERDLNIRSAGGLGHMLSLREATHLLVGGRVCAPTGWRHYAARFATRPAYLRFLALKRRLVQWFRLNLGPEYD